MWVIDKECISCFTFMTETGFMASLGLFASKMWQRSPRSAQQNKLSSSVVCHPLLFRLSLKWQDHYHEGLLLPLGNICMSASLSASFSISICHPFIVLFSCFLIPYFILPDTLVLSVILSLCGGWIRMDKLRGTKRAMYMKKEKSQRELERQSVLNVDIQTLSSCRRLCWWDPWTKWL